MKGWTCVQCKTVDFPARILYSNRSEKTEASGKWYVVLLCLTCNTRLVVDKGGIWRAAQQRDRRAAPVRKGGE